MAMAKTGVRFNLADPGPPCYPHAPNYRHSFVKPAPLKSVDLPAVIGVDDAKIERIFYSLATTCVLKRDVYVFQMKHLWNDETLFSANWNGLFRNHIDEDGPRGRLDASSLMVDQFKS